MMWTSYLLAVLFLGTGPTATASPGPTPLTEEVETYGEVKKGAKAPHLAAPLLSPAGQYFNAAKHYETQQALAGKQATVFVFFATYCKPCLAGIKALAQAEPQLKAAGVSVVLHNSMETAEQISPWLKTHGIPTSFQIILDEFGGDCERFGCKKGTELRLPLSVVVDEAGVTQAIFLKEGPDFVDRVLSASGTPKAGK